MKGKYDKDLSGGNQYYNQSNENNYGYFGVNNHENGLKATFDVAQHLNDDSHKKLAKLQK